MKKVRKGSWTVLLVTVALSYSLLRYCSRIPAYLFVPITFITKFVVEHYEAEIISAGQWLKYKFFFYLKKFRRLKTNYG